MTDERMMETLKLLQKADIPNEVITLLLDQHLRLADANALLDEAYALLSDDEKLGNTYWCECRDILLAKLKKGN